MTTILLADDDKHFLAVMARFLGQAGYRTVTARNGQEAVDLAAAEYPAMFVLDVALPFLTGDEVARRVGGDAPVLFISGRDLDRLVGLDGPRFTHMSKPCDLDDVLAHVRSVVGDPRTSTP